MADDKERVITTSSGDTVKIKNVLKNIGKLNLTAQDLLDNIKAFPLTRNSKNEEKLRKFRDEIDAVITKETDRFVSSDSGANGIDLGLFFNNLFANNPKGGRSSIDVRGLLQNQSLDQLMNDENAQINLILSERYKNVNSMYEDIRLVTEQLAELSEVVDTFRDAIVNADNGITDISRTVKTNDKPITTEDESTLLKTIVQMEEGTGVKDKLKKIIIPETVRYGNYFVFVQPYRDLFAKFKAMDDKYKLRGPIKNSNMMMKIAESWTPTTEDTHTVECFFEDYKADFNSADKSITKDKFTTLVTEIMSEQIQVIDDEAVPLMEAAEVEALSNASVRKSIQEAVRKKKKNKSWNPVTNTDGSIGGDGKPTKYSDGILQMTSTDIRAEQERYEEEYSDITGVFMKMYDPRRVVPVFVMDYCIGYYVMYETVQETTSNVLNAVHTLSRTTMMFQNSRKREFENRLIGLIADRICRSIDKEFLRKNSQFKELIANAIAYDNFYQKAFRIQFVPSNYMVHFKINEDYNTHMGVSVLKRSLFYAMLYLTLLLFKIIMIVSRTGDTQLFLVKGNGVDSDISTQMNEIISDYQEKQISYNDFGSVSNVLAKVGRGKSIGIPVGVNGERAFDIEQLSGMQIDLDEPLLDLLRKAMISTTGCPSAMINYLEEVDFAKQIQMIHTKFMARTVTYQEETEIAVTDLYRKLLRYGDYAISDDDLDSLKFEWARPRALNTQNMSEVIGSAEQMAEFLVKVYEGDNSTNDQRMKDRLFSHFIKKYLLNGVFDWDKLEEDMRILGLELRGNLMEEEGMKIQAEEDQE